MVSVVKENGQVLISLDEDLGTADIQDFLEKTGKLVGAAGRTLTVNFLELEKTDQKSSSLDTIIFVFRKTCTNDSFLNKALDLLKPGGSIVIYEQLEKEKGSNDVVTYKERLSKLRLNGFKVKDEYKTVNDNEDVKGVLSKVYGNLDNVYEIVAEKPPYEIGASAPLSFTKPKGNVWKLEDATEDLINEDELCDENDIVKPDASSLRVCSTTGKRKACKDCSCGLAEELRGETKETTAKSSCGNCYLGDAFRCASCPYLGMPAFKPGEKVVIPDTGS